jgi:hypothetical protein
MNGSMYGAFIPTTNVWDVSEIYSTEVGSPEFKELLVRLYQNLNNMALSVNVKDSAMYTPGEFVNGQSFFPNPANNSSTSAAPSMRPAYRMLVNFGALPNATTAAVAHGLAANSGWTFTRIYGCATNPNTPQYLPIPYAGSGATGSIELWADGTNVNITTTANLSAYTTTYVILEYMKT